MKHRFSLRYVLVLISCCGLIGAAFGMLTNVVGIFFTPVADSLGIGRGAVSMTLTISTITLALGGMLTVQALRRFPVKVLLIAMALIFSGCTATLGLTTNLYVMYVLHAVRGLAAGITGNVLVTMVINQWFLKNSGTFTSIAMSFSGLIGAVLTPVLSAVISSHGWRMGYFVTAGIILLLELPSILCPFSLKPDDIGETPYGGRPEEVKETGPARSRAGSHGSAPARSAASHRNGAVSVHSNTANWMSDKRLLVLFLLVLMYGIAAAFITSYPQHFPGIADSFQLSKETGTMMVSVCLVVNSCGKLLFGLLTDRIGARKAVLLYAAMILTGTLLLVFVRQPWAMFGAAALIGFAYALATVGTVMVVRTVFGLDYYGQVYPKVNLIATVGSAFGVSVIGFIYDGAGSYIPALVLMIVMIVVMAGAVVMVFRKR